MTTPQPPYGTPAYHTWNAQQIVYGETHQRNLEGGYRDVSRPPSTNRIPKGKYLSRVTRTIVFAFFTYACLSIAISSYLHNHGTGYTPFGQISTTADPHPNPIPFVMAGLLFGLLALLQLRKTMRVYRRRQEKHHEEASNRYAKRGSAPSASQHGTASHAVAWPAAAQVVYPQTGSTMPPTAAQNAAYNANGSAAQNAARNMHGNGQ